MNKPELAQLRLTDDGGMSYVIFQEDESFIIIDGGMAFDSYEENERELLAYFKRTVGEKSPVIAAWFITHFHLDHIDFAARFLLEHKDDVTVRLFAYNHPGHVESLREVEREIEWFKAMDAHPEAQRYVLNTKDVLSFSSCDAKILISEADGGAAGGSQNSISAAISFTFKNGRRFMALGDCDTLRMSQLMDEKSNLYVTKEELKSDFLQVAHHGLPLGSLECVRKNAELYKAIAPSVCFFDVDRKTFLNRSQYTEEKWADNYYLLHSGSECYDNHETTLVDITTMNIQRVTLAK